MNDIQVKASAARRCLNLAKRLVIVLLLAGAIGAVLNSIAAALDRSNRPAGFSRGVVQGALMPMAFPNLLCGRDVTIYSSNNDGVRYKLGYTTGVNGCGAIFFGFLFWRLNRWRKAVVNKAT
jgi:hypothetical protein